MRFLCTYSDRNYFTRALALIESLAQTQRGDWRLYFVCLDELTRTLLEAMKLPNVVAVPLHELERGDDALLATRKSRTLVEYYWTMTPTVILRLLERNPEIDVLTYLDSDLLFFSTMDPIYAELGAGSVLIHEHRYSPDLAHLERESGRFNVGLLSFRRDADGIGVLRWWRERCIEWCSATPEPGRFGDQMYLNDWPRRFRRVVVLEHVGAGLAPWNHGQYAYQQDAQGRLMVNGLPIVFFHFHSLVTVQPEIVVPSKHAAYQLPEPVLRHAYAPYAEALRRALATVRGVLPSFHFGLLPEFPIAAEHVALVRADPADVDGAGHRRFARWGEWSCLFADAPEPKAHIA